MTRENGNMPMDRTFKMPSFRKKSGFTLILLLVIGASCNLRAESLIDDPKLSTSREKRESILSHSINTKIMASMPFESNSLFNGLDDASKAKINSLAEAIAQQFKDDKTSKNYEMENMLCRNIQVMDSDGSIMAEVTRMTMGCLTLEFHPAFRVMTITRNQLGLNLKLESILVRYSKFEALDKVQTYIGAGAITDVLEKGKFGNLIKLPGIIARLANFSFVGIDFGFGYEVSSPEKRMIWVGPEFSASIFDSNLTVELTRE